MGKIITHLKASKQLHSVKVKERNGYTITKNKTITDISCYL